MGPVPPDGHEGVVGILVGRDVEGLAKDALEQRGYAIVPLGSARQERRVIKKLGDIIQAIAEREAIVLAKRKLSHGPTIGRMYEGLTSKLLDIAVPSGLRVVSGFALGKDGKHSPQIDCMIVYGDGIQIDHTDEWEYPIDRVLAVVEVKKRLNPKEIDDAYMKFQKLTMLEPSDMNVPIAALQESFKSLTAKALPQDPDSLDPDLLGLYRFIGMEARMPIRILIGYEGYKKEEAFRKAVLAQTKSLHKKNGFGPTAWPSVICNLRHSIVKGNGFPWSARVGNEIALMSSLHGIRPAEVLLEIIWTKMCYLGIVDPSVFGEDLTIEYASSLILGSFRGNFWRIRGTVLSGDDDAPASGVAAWEPTEVTQEEGILLSYFSAIPNNEADLTDPEVGKIVLPRLIRSLKAKKLIVEIAGNPNRLTLVNPEFALMINPDGTSYVGDNTSGRMMRWAGKNLKMRGSGS